MAGGWTIVLDVGKTFSKASLWDEHGVCRGQRSHVNQSLDVGEYQALDAVGIEQWLETALAQFAALGPVAAIIPVAHGAAAAVIRNGRLHCAPIDYEWTGVAADRAAYQSQRDPFIATGSPALPAGLNLGAQFHWLDSRRSGDLRGLIVPWAQYWAWLLCGVAACEISSLGCHTDLWRPYEHAPSDLAVRRGWAARLAPMAAADAVLGTLTPEWVARTGLSDAVKISCGLHDSNAALLGARSRPEIAGHDVTVLSTGTWFVAMRSPLKTDPSVLAHLPESRDCLVNVDVAGLPVPSSRFMGGREIELLAGPEAQRSQASGTDAALPDCMLLDCALKAVECGAMILPSSVSGVGPFPHAKLRWVGARQDQADATARAQLYAALMADVSLDLIGSADTLVIDGRFARAAVFVQSLAGLRPAAKVLVGCDEHGVARGALRLVNGRASEVEALKPVSPLPADLKQYRARWREAAEHSGEATGYT